MSRRRGKLFAARGLAGESGQEASGSLQDGPRHVNAPAAVFGAEKPKKQPLLSEPVDRRQGRGSKQGGGSDDPWREEETRRLQLGAAESRAAEQPGASRDAGTAG